MRVFLAFALTLSLANAAVRIERLPGPGLQPQTIVTPDGTVHMIQLAGDPKASDILYRQRNSRGEWSEAITVNSQPGSAIAIGTIRGPQLALGRKGQVHVLWNGSHSAAQKSSNSGAPLWYARLHENGRGFSEQIDLSGKTHELDGGGSIAADDDGRVFVAWHASPPGSRGENQRQVFLAVSTNDGGLFAQERAISPAGTGACGCCGLTVLANAQAEVFLLFRTAPTSMQRDMAILLSSDHGTSFRTLLSDPWSITQCPMSSAGLTSSGNSTWAGWETTGQVRFAKVSGSDSTVQPRTFGPVKGAKHPRIAVNKEGKTLLLWTEGTGWQRGGSFAWQVLDSKGEPSTEQGKQAGIPAWSFATAYARTDGDFVILY